MHLSPNGGIVMAGTVINEDKRAKEGLPKVKFTRRGNMYTTPKEIVSSDKGKRNIQRLSAIKVEKRIEGRGSYRVEFGKNS